MMFVVITLLTVTVTFINSVAGIEYEQQHEKQQQQHTSGPNGCPQVFGVMHCATEEMCCVSADLSKKKEIKSKSQDVSVTGVCAKLKGRYGYLKHNKCEYPGHPFRYLAGENQYGAYCCMCRSLVCN